MSRRGGAEGTQGFGNLAASFDDFLVTAGGFFVPRRVPVKTLLERRKDFVSFAVGVRLNLFLAGQAA